ncbi:MAG: class I SAM-dependent methyltransferase [Candidatus Bathyarchaeota archaeon]|nr:class I SAM-dependent methyltransferase [Candidatus Bathyarchaeota archaeon]
MGYEPDRIREYYNSYGDREWDRLESTHGIIQYKVTTHIISKYLHEGDHVLDAGSGPGRYSIWLARNDAKVYVSDISDDQLQQARDRISEAGVMSSVLAIKRHDICDLGEIPDDTFDLVLCLGGALSYVRDRRHQAIDELIRVAKPGSPLIISVMSLLGTFHLLAPFDGAEFLENITDHVEWDPATSFPDVMNSVPGSSEWHAPMTLYTSTYIQEFLEEHGCKVIEMVPTNTISSAGFNMDKIKASPKALKALIDLEIKFCKKSGLLDMGQHLIAVAWKM